MTRRSILGRDPQARQIVHDGILAGWSNERVYQEVRTFGVSRSAVGRYVQQFRVECDMIADCEESIGAGQGCGATRPTDDDPKLHREQQEITQLTARAIEVLRRIQDHSVNAKEAYVRANPVDTYEARRSQGLSKHTVDMIRRQVLGCDV
jgi:hypothetical protein